MKKVLFSLSLVFMSIVAWAQIDSFCFVQIVLDQQAGAVQLTAIAFDVTDPIGVDFEYLWDTGETTASIPLPNGNGTYCVTATSTTTDCEVSDCYTLNLSDCEITPWLSFTGELIAFSAGIPPFNYTWDTGDTTSSIPVVDGDTYCVTVTDALGCVDDTCVTVSFDPDPPIDSICIAFIFPLSDSLGNIVLVAFGGGHFPNGAPTTYLWSTGDTTATIIASSIGEYCVTVTNGTCSEEACVDLANFGCEVTIGCDPPGTFSAFSSGIGPFTYLWSTGDTTFNIPVVAGQNYCVTVTDALGCSADTCMVSDSMIWPPIDTFPFDSFCVVWISQQQTGAGIQLSAIAFPPSTTGLVEYLWSTGETTPTIIGSIGDNYCVTVTLPMFNCTATSCIDLSISDCTDVVVLCDPDGTVAVFSNGIPPYTYVWNTGDSTPIIQGEADSTYCVTITDAVGCIVDTCVTAMVGPVDTTVLGGIIFGEIFESDSNIVDNYQGYVYLYKKDQNGDFILDDSSDVSVDFGISIYGFGDLADGEYLTKAIVSSSTTGDDYIPTYHHSAMEWNQADVIELELTAIGQILAHAPIELLGVTSVNGPGSISGLVTDLDDLMSGPSRNGTGLTGVTLILTDELDQSITYVITNADGEFLFDNLPYGTYRIHADYLNVTGPFATVTIGPNQPDGYTTFEVEGQDLLLASKEIDISSKVSVYPNPVHGQLTIQVAAHIEIQEMSLTDMNGKIMWQGQPTLSDNVIKIEAASFNNGMHMLHLITNEGIATKKIMVVN